MKHSREAALTERLDALETAADAGHGRLADGDVAAARTVVERGRERHQLSAEHTVVALAGATGGGKSSLFNELTGLDLGDVDNRLNLHIATRAWQVLQVSAGGPP